MPPLGHRDRSHPLASVGVKIPRRIRARRRKSVDGGRHVTVANPCVVLAEIAVVACLFPSTAEQPFAERRADVFFFYTACVGSVFVVDYDNAQNDVVFIKLCKMSHAYPLIWTKLSNGCVRAKLSCIFVAFNVVRRYVRISQLSCYINSLVTHVNAQHLAHIAPVKLWIWLSLMFGIR